MPDKQHAQEMPVFEMILSGKEPTDFAMVAATRSENTVEALDTDLRGQEGQLAVDVVETAADLIVVSTMAGADPQSIEVYVHNDLLTIRGRRESTLKNELVSSIYHEECFWGTFSRTIVLPVPVNGALAQATYKNGVLELRVPKRATTQRSIPVHVIDE